MSELIGVSISGSEVGHLSAHFPASQMNQQAATSGRRELVHPQPMQTFRIFIFVPNGQIARRHTIIHIHHASLA